MFWNVYLNQGIIGDILLVGILNVWVYREIWRRWSNYFNGNTFRPYQNYSVRGDGREAVVGGWKIIQMDRRIIKPIVYYNFNILFRQMRGGSEGGFLFLFCTCCFLITEKEVGNCVCTFTAGKDGFKRIEEKTVPDLN